MSSERRPTERVVERAGVRLRCLDWGGAGPAVLLLHGLAGQAGEWEETARLLRGAGHRVLAFDQRGHGHSTRAPAAVTAAAHVADTVAVIEEFGLGRTVLAGQSLGGRTALLTAAAHPRRVRALALIECDADTAPDAGPVRTPPLETPPPPVLPLEGSAPPEPPAVTWLRSWPLPFPTRRAAVTFLGGGRVGEGWAAGLERRAEGWWPRFDVEVMAAALRALGPAPTAEAWAALSCPALFVGAEHGILDPGRVDRMLAARPATRSACVPRAGHDVHLERPEALHLVLADFLASL